MSKRSAREGRKRTLSSFLFRPFRIFRLHPLFLVMGIWYAFSGELFLFFLSTLVAVQHECAHAFAAQKLGYKLNAIVLTPYGAVLDSDLKGISLKDEIYVASCGPICNLVTAIFFVALWWFFPSVYPFTDVAFYASLSVALVNLLPCYPLDGGRILKCSLTKAFAKSQPILSVAEKKADRLCLAVTLFFALQFLFVFALQAMQKRLNFSLLAFGIFLLFGGFGNGDRGGVYKKMDFSFLPPLAKGVEIRRVAVSENCPIKDALQFISRGSYLFLEVYDEQANRLFDLPQNLLSFLFERAKTPYETLRTLYVRENAAFFAQKEQKV